MLHLIIMAMFVVIVLHDAVVQSGVSEGAQSSLHGAQTLASGWVWAVAVGMQVLLGLGTVLIVRALARDVENRGAWRSMVLADRTLQSSRWLALALHAFNILVLGWLDAVRAFAGDVVALDELVVIVPPLLVIVAGWWAYYPIDCAIRNATMYRLLETGRPLYPPISRGQYVLLNIRHQILLSLVPILMISAMSEAIDRAVAMVVHRAGEAGLVGEVGGWLASEQNIGPTKLCLQIVALVGIFAVSPVILRRVWDTVELGLGPINDRLMNLCRMSNVRVRRLLVWRTQGTMINGAVIGLIGPLRYVLLTDALLDQLPERQVEAVMAHEVGHARHAHMPWLAATMIAGVSGSALMLGLVSWGGLSLITIAGHPQLADAVSGSLGLSGVLVVGSFAVGIWWFGFVSRRFEWQADAFAVQQLSRVLRHEEPTSWEREFDAGPSEGGGRSVPKPSAIRREAVEAMVGALDSVASLNHLSRTRFSWRHGSIAYRQLRLRAMVSDWDGKPPIDRTSRWLKRAMGMAMALLVAAMVIEWMAASPSTDQQIPVRSGDRSR